MNNLITYGYTFISNKSTKRSLDFSVLSIPGLVFNRTISFCSFVVKLQNYCSQTTIGFDRSFIIKFKCHLFQKAILDLCNQMLSVSFKLLKHFSYMSAFSILPPELFYPTAQMFYDNLWVDIMLLEAGPCFFLAPLKAHLKQCRPHSRTSQHRNEKKHSVQRGAWTVDRAFCAT